MRFHVLLGRGYTLPVARKLTEIPPLSLGAEFDPHHLHFSQHGDALLLADKHTFAVAYPVVDGAGEGQGQELSESAAERTWVEDE